MLPVYIYVYVKSFVHLICSHFDPNFGGFCLPLSFFAKMVKTRAKVRELQARLEAAEPKAIPCPKVRVTGKKADPSKAAPPTEPASRPAKETSKTKSELPPFEITWDNLPKVMKWFSMSEAEATSVLLQVVGPDSRGADFWNNYKKRVKEEKTEKPSEVPEAPEVPEPKRRRLKPAQQPVPPS